MRLGNRIFLSFFAVILVATLASTLTGALLLSQALRGEALTRVQLNLKGARVRLAGELELLAVTVDLQAKGLAGRIAAPHPAEVSLMFPGLLPDALARKGLYGVGEEKGFLRFSLRELADLGVDTTRLARLPLSGDGELLCLFAARRGQAGHAVVLSMLNGNERLVRSMQENLFSSELYGTKPFGTVTVFCGDTRVATTVLGPDGKVATGTQVSPEVRRQVLEEGQTWLGRAFVVDEWYLSAYEPIRDPRGERIGILYVGVLEQKYQDIRTRSVYFLAALIVPILGLALVFGFFIVRGISRPLSRLVEASGQIASGNLDLPLAQLPAPHEIELLSDAYTAMQGAIRDRENLLRTQNQELEQANRDYQELLSFVTHELNNSVGSLLLNVSLLEEEASGKIPRELDELVDQVLRDVERFRDMVKNYLNLSRLEKGTLRFNPDRFDVRCAGDRAGGGAHGPLDGAPPLPGVLGLARAGRGHRRRGPAGYLLQQFRGQRPQVRQGLDPLLGPARGGSLAAGRGQRGHAHPGGKDPPVVPQVLPPGALQRRGRPGPVPGAPHPGAARRGGVVRELPGNRHPLRDEAAGGSALRAVGLASISTLPADALLL